MAYVENFQRRVIQDALSEATTAYWERRARAFEDAYVREVAAACRAKARLLDGSWTRLEDAS